MSSLKNSIDFSNEMVNSILLVFEENRREKNMTNCSNHVTFVSHAMKWVHFSFKSILHFAYDERIIHVSHFSPHPM